MAALSRLLFITAALVAPLACSAPILEARIVDGDTIRIGSIGFRLHGIDAPEKRQRCNAADGSDWPCGQDASSALLTMTANAHVYCEVGKQDRYRRFVSRCYAGRSEINKALVRRGLAWAYRKYSSDYLAAENQARADRLGIWQAPTQPAWEFRHQRRPAGLKRAS